MVATLTGENSFLLQQQLDKLVSGFLAVNDELALERVDGQEASHEHIREALTSLPFLADRKMVVLRAPSTNKQFTENFEQLFDEISDTTDVILVEPKLDKRLAYYKLLKQKTDFHELSELDPNGLAQWLVGAANDHEASISLADARYLVDRIGASQQLLASELDKLALFDSKITRKSIDSLTDPAPQSTVFQLLEAAFSGNTKRAMQLYQEQRALKVEPLEIVAMLSWQLRILAVIKTAGERTADQIAQEAKLNPYSIRKSQAVARKLSLTKLKKLITDLLHIDTQLKRTSTNPDEAMQNYLLTLSSGS